MLLVINLTVEGARREVEIRDEYEKRGGGGGGRAAEINISRSLKY